jgi:triosephosphate isomerase
MADSRKPIISGNWKMHHNHFEAIQAVQKLHYRLESDDYEAVEVTVHPPFTDIRSIQTLIDSDKMKIGLGAQNCPWEDKGAFTGEIAPSMLAKLNKKVKAVIANKMIPIVCCGETLEEREGGMAEAKVEGQVREGLAGLSSAMVGDLVVAYEPIWAIGTGKTATAEDAQTMCAKVREVIREIHGAEASGSVRVQYGGSVKPGNIVELMGQPDIDGALVGGASLNPDEFAAIVQYRNH